MHHILTLLSCLTLLTGCSASKVVQSWADPNLPKPKKLMVFGVTSEEGLRREYEDLLSQALSARGLDAIPSYNVLQVKGEVDKEKVIAAVHKAGVDGVFITRLVTVTTRVDAVPQSGPVQTYPFSAASSYWPTYYVESYRLVEHDLAYIESNIYATPSSALIMSIMTQTIDPNYSDRQIRDLVAVIVEELGKKRFLSEP